MFTGIIQSVGTVLDFAPVAAGARLVVETGLPADALKIGDSIAVDGCCQTIERFDGDQCVFHALNETLDRTIFRSYKRGTKVNLEPAMRVGDRLGGHIVQGHIDCVAKVLGIRRRAGDVALDIARPDASSFPLVPKGSIAISGVSLTVAELTANQVTVCIIPHTWENTTLQFLKPGSLVNLEADVVGKYLLGLAAPYRSSNITMESLSAAGFN